MAGPGSRPPRPPPPGRRAAPVDAPPAQPASAPRRASAERLATRGAGPTCARHGPAPGVEVPADAGKAQEQLLDPRLVELQRQDRALGPATKVLITTGACSADDSDWKMPLPDSGSTAMAASPTRIQSLPTHSPARIAVLLRACTWQGSNACSSNSCATSVDCRRRAAQYAGSAACPAGLPHRHRA